MATCSLVSTRIFNQWITDILILLQEGHYRTVTPFVNIVKPASSPKILHTVDGSTRTVAWLTYVSSTDKIFVYIICIFICLIIWYEWQSRVLLSSVAWLVWCLCVRLSSPLTHGAAPRWLFFCVGGWVDKSVRFLKRVKYTVLWEREVLTS